MAQTLRKSLQTELGKWKALRTTLTGETWEITSEEEAHRLKDLAEDTSTKMRRSRVLAAQALEDWLATVAKLKEESRVKEEGLGSTLQGDYEAASEETDTMLEDVQANLEIIERYFRQKREEARQDDAFILEDKDGEGERVAERREQEAPRDVDPSTLRRAEITEERNSREHSEAHRGSGGRIRLPAQTLPTFAGDPLLYREFKNLFLSSMEHADLSNTNQLQYLLSSLTGEARQMASGYPLTGESYADVWRALDLAYSDEQLVKVKLHKALLALRKGDGTLAEASSMVQEARRLVRQLEQLNENTNNPTLKTVLQEKLPTVLLKELLKEQRKRSAPMTTMEILDFIQGEIQDQRHVSELGGSLKVKVNVARDTKDEKPKDFKKKTDGGCDFCTGKHKPADCQKYPTVEARRERIKEIRGCFRCMKTGHQASKCRSKEECPNHPRGRHHALLCIPDAKKPAWHPEKQVTYTCQMGNGEHGQEGEVVLPTITVRVKNPRTGVVLKLKAFLDTGSQISFISEKARRKLDLLKEGERDLDLSTFGDKEGKWMRCGVFKAHLMEKTGGARAVTLLSTEHITTMMRAVNSKEATMLQPPMRKVQPDLLLSAGIVMGILPGTTTESGLVVMDTTIGEVVAGQLKGAEAEELQVFSIVEQNKELEKQLKMMFSLESIGITENPEENEDEKAKQEFYRKAHRLPDGTISVGLLWKDEKGPPGDNRGPAYHRLKSLAAKLIKDGKMEEYDAAIMEQVQQGFIEEIDENEPAKGHVWYAPHHAVVNPQKPNKKPRIVFDASAGGRGKSINSLMMAGPNLVPRIPEVLTRMRSYDTVVTADIAKAYNRIALNEEDRDAVRLLWLADPTKPVSPGNVKTFRFRVLPFGVACAPYCLQEGIRFFLESEETSLAEEVLQDLYVDNLLVSAENTEEARKKAAELKDLFKKAHLPLQEFFSNDPAIQKEFGDEGQADPEHVKFLGTTWNLKKDELEVHTGSRRVERDTKSSVLSGIASIFDPLGFLSPALLPARLFMQKLTEDKEKGWDTPLDESTQAEWEEISDQLMGGRIAVKRKITVSEGSTLHVFTDASQDAYGAVIYLRTPREGGVEISLLTSKAKVRPAGVKMTIPRIRVGKAIFRKLFGNGHFIPFSPKP